MRKTGKLILDIKIDSTVVTISYREFMEEIEVLSTHRYCPFFSLTTFVWAPRTALGGEGIGICILPWGGQGNAKALGYSCTPFCALCDTSLKKISLYSFVCLIIITQSVRFCMQTRQYKLKETHVDNPNYVVFFSNIAGHICA